MKNLKREKKEKDSMVVTIDEEEWGVVVGRENRIPPPPF